MTVYTVTAASDTFTTFVQHAGSLSEESRNWATVASAAFALITLILLIVTFVRTAKSQKKQEELLGLAQVYASKQEELIGAAKQHAEAAEEHAAHAKKSAETAKDQLAVMQQQTAIARAQLHAELSRRIEEKAQQCEESVGSYRRVELEFQRLLDILVKDEGCVMHGLPQDFVRKHEQSVLDAVRGMDGFAIQDGQVFLQEFRGCAKLANMAQARDQIGGILLGVQKQKKMLEEVKEVTLERMRRKRADQDETDAVPVKRTD